MKTFITSDLHFGHANIMKYCPDHRAQFNGSVEEMDRFLINQWRETVAPGDVVYFLGDMFFYRKPEQIERLALELTGHIEWVLGNHDYRDAIDIFMDARQEYTHLHKYLELSHNKNKMIMFHYPIEEWNKSRHGSVHFHGHQHGSGRKHPGRRMDVGWDCFGRILELDEAVEMAMVNPIHTTESHHKGNM